MSNQNLSKKFNCSDTSEVFLKHAHLFHDHVLYLYGCTIFFKAMKCTAFSTYTDFSN